MGTFLPSRAVLKVRRAPQPFAAPGCPGKRTVPHKIAGDKRAFQLFGASYSIARTFSRSALMPGSSFSRSGCSSRSLTMSP